METVSRSIAGASGELQVRQYGRLLAKYTSKVITSERENESALAAVEELIEFEVRRAAFAARIG